MARISSKRSLNEMVDGLPTLRTSERTTFRQCPQKWYWGYRHGLRRKDGEAIALWFGTGIHLALAEWYVPGFKRGVHPVATWNDYCNGQSAKVRTVDDEFEDARDLGVAMLEGYLERWKEEDAGWKIVQPEMTAWVALRDPDTGEPFVNYVMTADGVIENHNEGKQVELLETKTAARIMTQHLHRDDQAGTYPIVMSDFLMARGVIREPIETVRYNILRKDVPKEDDRPRDEKGRALNKDGSVSKRQEAQAPLFHRENVYRSRAEQENQIRRIHAEVRNMNRMREDPSLIFKNHSHECNFCPFVEMCDLHETGGDWETLRDWAFKRQNPYVEIGKSA